MKKENVKPLCFYCNKECHDEDKCWKLHLELKPKWFRDWKGKQKTIATIQQDLR